MKNYEESDYAANKNAKGIVYRFADQIVEVTLEDYLRENPGKTEADYAELKALSDSDYYERDRENYRQTWKNVPIHGLDNTNACAVTSPEDEITGLSDTAEKKKRRRELASKALGKLTDIQRQRYLRYHVDGLSTWQIAKGEGSNQKSVYESLQAAEKKIKKILAEGY